MKKPIIIVILDWFGRFVWKFLKIELCKVYVLGKSYSHKNPMKSTPSEGE